MQSRSSESYTRRLARAVRDGAWRRLGTGFGISTVLLAPVLAALFVYLGPEHGTISFDALVAAVAGAVAAVVGLWLIAVLWSLLKAPAEIDATLTRDLERQRDAEKERADQAEEQLRAVVDDLLGAFNLSGIDIRMGHLPNTNVCSVSIGIVLQNSAQVPIRYEIRRLHVVVEGQASADQLGNLTGYTPPFGGVSTHYSADVLEIPWHFPMTGELDFDVAFGVRSKPPSWVYRGTIKVVFAHAGEGQPDALVQLWNWVGEPVFERLAD